MKKALLALAVLGAVALVVVTALAYRERRREEARGHEEEAKKAQTLEALAALRERIEGHGATSDTYPPLSSEENDPEGWMTLSVALAEKAMGGEIEGPWDGWGRHLQYRRPGPVHKDGWDIYSLGADGKGMDRDLYLGASYVPDPRSTRVDETYARETRERLEALKALVLELPARPESHALEDLLAALKAQGLESRRAKFMDLWGHKLRWCCPGRIHPRGWDLYSIGPNGEDEEGAGDDLVTGSDSR